MLLFVPHSSEYDVLMIKDLRDPSTTPLNFTKSINLALSERGINSIKNAGVEGLVDQVLKETIPMHARMIHGRTKLGEVYADSQDYDVHGRVSIMLGTRSWP